MSGLVVMALVGGAVVGAGLLSVLMVLASSAVLGLVCAVVAGVRLLLRAAPAVLDRTTASRHATAALFPPTAEHAVRSPASPRDGTRGRTRAVAGT